ncbi:hypothetical protein GGR58DRAFT_123686 [Xylaria digitata]|nr:hypothetical protein GGR58DRAFT_123686 [Xylaria digitata]
MIHSLFTILFLICLAASESVSLTKAEGFASQRPCAQACFGGSLYPNAGLVAEGIGCESLNPQNECVCRSDLQPDADDYISSCVDTQCSGRTLDIDSAVSIYDAYCTSAGFIRSTPATVTSDSSSRTSPSETRAPAPTNSESGGNNNESVDNGGGNTGGGNGLGVGDIVGIVVGVLGFIATAIGTWFTYKSIMKKKPPRYPPHGGTPR